MKKLFKISAVLLAVGILISLIGVILIRRDNVAPAGIYSALEDNLKLSDDGFEYTEPQRYDLTEVKTRSNAKEQECELNEFNSIELYGEKCSVKFTSSSGEKMAVKLNGGTLITANTGGVFYIQAIGGESDCELTVAVPDIYKGGVNLQLDGCDADLGSIDSAMDMTLNFRDSAVEAKSLSADNITIAASGASLKLGALKAADELYAAVRSTDIRLSAASAQTQTLKADHSTADIRNIAGRWTLDSNMSKVEALFRQLSGGITIDVNAGSAVIRLPENVSPEVEHSEKYGVFTNDLVVSGSPSTADEAVRSMIDCRVQYGVVTLEN